MAEGRTEGAGGAVRIELWIVGAIALTLAALAVWRCTFSVGLTDDAVYVALPLRLAQGARVFADEMSLQSLGYLLVVPFVMAWKGLFGMTGIVLAVRVFYVIVGGTVAVLTYLLLRPSFTPAACALAAAIPALAVPYNILGLNYNTSAALSFTLAATLMFAALRDGRRWLAVAAGLAVGWGVLSYASLAPAALVLLASFAILARGRGLTMWTALAAAGFLALAAGSLVAMSSIGDIMRTAAYLPRNVVSLGTPLAKLSYIRFYTLESTIKDRWLAPLWVLAAVAAVRPLPRWLRSVALMLLPAAAALSGVMRLVQHQDAHWFSSVAAGFAMIFMLAALVPVLVDAVAERDEDIRRLLFLALPFAVSGYLLVAYSTSAGWWRASVIVAMGPLAVAVIAAWADQVRAGLGVVGAAVASMSLLVALFSFLFSSSHDDGAPFTLHTRVRWGPYSGIKTTAKREVLMVAMRDAVEQWVRPSDRVLVMGGPFGYLFADNVMATNAVWLYAGPSDQEALDYYTRSGRLPDVAFVNRSVVGPDSMVTDPLMSYLARSYEPVGWVADTYRVWVRR